MRNIQVTTNREINGWFDRWKEKHTTKTTVIVSATNLHGEEVSEMVEILRYDKVLTVVNWIEFRMRWILRKPEWKTISGIGITKNSFK